MHKLEIDQLLENQERKLESELIALKAELSQEYDEKIQKLQTEFNQQQDTLKRDHELSLLVKLNLYALVLFLNYCLLNFICIYQE